MIFSASRIELPFVILGIMKMRYRYNKISINRYTNEWVNLNIDLDSSADEWKYICVNVNDVKLNIKLELKTAAMCMISY